MFSGLHKSSAHRLETNCVARQLIGQSRSSCIGNRAEFSLLLIQHAGNLLVRRYFKIGGEPAATVLPRWQKSQHCGSTAGPWAQPGERTCTTVWTEPSGPMLGGPQLRVVFNVTSFSDAPSATWWGLEFENLGCVHNRDCISEFTVGVHLRSLRNAKCVDGVSFIAQRLSICNHFGCAPSVSNTPPTHTTSRHIRSAASSEQHPF